jgi:hypothetical protein
MNSDGKKIVKIVVIILFFAFIFSYAYFRSRELIFGVKIEDVSIVDGAKIEESTLLVTGKAKNALNLYLNGREISIDKEGNFSETIALLSGYNRVKIEARDKFGNTDEKNYQLIHSPTETIEENP